MYTPNALNLNCWKAFRGDHRSSKRPKKTVNDRRESQRKSTKESTESTQQTSTLTTLETEFGEEKHLLTRCKEVPLKKNGGTRNSFSSDFTWEASGHPDESGHVGTKSINIPSTWSFSVDDDEEERKEKEWPNPLVLTVRTDSWKESGDTSTSGNMGKKLTSMTTTSKGTSTELTSLGKE